MENTTITGDALADALIIVVLLAMLIERGLAIIFENKKANAVANDWDLKPWLAAIVSIVVCASMNLNLLSVLRAECSSCGAKGTGADFDQGFAWFTGVVLTGLIVAGGSAGAVKLFQDVLGFRRSSRDLIRETKDLGQQADKAEAEARLQKALADRKIAEVQAASATEIVGSQLPGLGTNFIDDAITERTLEQAYVRALKAIIPT